MVKNMSLWYSMFKTIVITMVQLQYNHRTNFIITVQSL